VQRLADQVSAVFVVTNSLRLRRFQPGDDRPYLPGQ
jgi:cation transport ATPase